MKKKSISVALLSMVSAAALAAGNRELHRPPYDFLFDTHIDTHQESQLKNDGTLKGRLYIIYTGDTDPDSGLPVARHPRGEMHDEECGVDPIDCKVGWIMRGKPSQAKFVFHSGVDGNDHPVWKLASRNDIPQRGYFTFFHWLGAGSSDDRAPDGVPPECDVQMAGQLEGEVAVGDLTLEDVTTWEGAEVHVGGGAENVVCPGWLIQLTAVRSFAFEHGGEKVVVTPGSDNRSHINILTNYAIVPDITAGHGGGGGEGGGGHEH